MNIFKKYDEFFAKRFQEAQNDLVNEVLRITEQIPEENF